MEKMNILFVLLTIFILLNIANRQWHIPLLTIINRWLRWMLFAFLFMLFIIKYFENEYIFYSIMPIFLIGLLIYILFETIYNWILIDILSKSDMKLFPIFYQNIQGDEWPSHKKYHAIKDWLKKHKFFQKQSIKSNITESLYLRSSIYDDPENNTRLQILFIPQYTGDLNMYLIFSSLIENNQRIITDNISLPFGGFYPESWDIIRKPLIQSIEILFKIHNKRISKFNKKLINWNNEPLNDLNEQSVKLEELNIENGFLIAKNLQEEYGRISGDGRYRIWKEILALNYFGKSIISKI